jgi:hypothetical protein
MVRMPSPLLPPGRTGDRPRPSTIPLLAMGAVTLAALATAVWVGLIALLAADSLSCRLFTEDLANLRCNRISERFGDLPPAAVLVLLIPPAAGVALGWSRAGRWGFTALAAALVLVGLVGCALLWAVLTAPGPSL